MGLWLSRDRASRQRRADRLVRSGKNHLSRFLQPRVQIARRIGASWQGRSLAYEAAGLVIDRGVSSPGLERIVAYSVPANERSWRLMDRLGMRPIGRFEHPSLPSGHELWPHVAYDRTASARRDRPRPPE